MLADQIAYVALVSNDPALAVNVFERHFGLPRADLSSAAGPVPVFALGRSALEASHQPPVRPSNNTPAPTTVSPQAKRRNSAISGAIDRPTMTVCPGGMPKLTSRYCARV